MSNSLGEIFRCLSRPMEPIATGRPPVLGPPVGVRAVLFDIYGTLLISGAGEVGTAKLEQPPSTEGPPPDSPCPLADALGAMGIIANTPASRGVALLAQEIEASHAASRRAGIEYPEVDIVAVWAEVLAELARRGVIDAAASRAADPRRLAVEYEARSNPCWPMPHLAECLDGLRQAGLVLGLVSNAQFYTPIVFEALSGRPPEAWGVAPSLQCYSFQCGVAKPGRAMFERALAVLAEQGIGPGETLYVGNDMLNDVWPAARLGLRTALFAGDARSLRLRDGHPSVDNLAPDFVLTDLNQLEKCMMV